MNHRNNRLGKALRIPKEVESVVEDLETGIDIISSNDSIKNYNDRNGLMGCARTGGTMTNGLGTVAIVGQQKNKVEEPKRRESEGRHSFLFSSSVEIREYDSLTDFESSWGLRRQVGTGGSKNDRCLAAAGGARAAAATAAASPLPLNPIESMAMQVVDMGAEVSSLRRRSEKDGSNCAARFAIVRWMNVVLDPWGEYGGGSNDNITTNNILESSMSWLAHREALKKRVWCGQAVGATNDIGGPVGLVLDKLSKDCVAVGQCVVRMLCDFN
jgi:hypothetical protein